MGVNMSTSIALRDPIQHICMKKQLTSVWEACTVEDVLANRVYPERLVLGKMDKATMPVFGFDKTLGTRSNTQLFPTHFVILELDTPPVWKQKITKGCQKTLACAKANAYTLFWQFHHDNRLPYYWMYLTPSTCGIRFVLRTDRPVINKLHYRQVVLDYLRYLYRLTNGKLNADYHDILIDQGWFVPTFLHEFSSKKIDWNTQPYQAPTPREQQQDRTPSPCLNTYKTAREKLDLAIQFTKRNFRFVEGQRNNYIHNLACNCNRLGLLENEILIWMTTEYDLSESEIKATVASAYRNNRPEHGQLLKAI